MVMAVFQRLLIVIALTLSPLVVFAQSIEASVDRNEIARGDTLTLTLRVFDQRQGMQLDLNPLTEKFDVLSTRSSVQMRSVNGNVATWTDYIITLFPLEEGEITIPALEINGLTTDPITVNVVNQGPMSNQSNEELFLEIEVNKDSVYVQEQLLFTIRLFYTINGIRNPQFTELEMPDTVTRLIGSPNQYERLIDGLRYGVYEKRYVIFPQRSGPLEIPDILFRGEVTDGSSNFVFRNLNTRRVTAFIEGTTIDIKERPLEMQGEEFWLPLSNLSISEQWDGDINNMRVGDTIVRRITMTADGVDGAVLPPFGDSLVDGLNFYPDPPEIERTYNDGSIVGTRVETTSIVALEPGLLQLPEIVIPWWDINSDELRTTIIPATTLTIADVQGVVPSEQTVVSTGDLEELLQAAPELDPDALNNDPEDTLIEVDALYFNIGIALAVLVVLLAIYMLVIAPRQSVINTAFRKQIALIAKKYGAQENEATAFRHLKSAATSGDLSSLRQTLIVWSSHYFAPANIRSMEDIIQRKNEQELSELATALQAKLFNPNAGEPYETSKLIAQVAQLRKNKASVRKKAIHQEKYALPPLYKT